MDSIEIIKKNLSDKMAERDMAQKKLAALYSELAWELCTQENETGLFSALTDLSETVGEFFEPNDAISMAAFADRFVFRLSELYGREITPADFYFPMKGHGRVACVHNRYNDIAYDTLSKALEYPTVVYCEDTDAVINALASGHADFALLPTADGDKRIAAVYDALGEHMLHICAKHTCVQTDGGKIEISLVSLTFPFAVQRDDAVGISLSFIPSPICDIGTVLAAMTRLGAAVVEISPTDGGYFVALNANGENASQILTFMYLFTYGFIPYGVWKEN